MLMLNLYSNIVLTKQLLPFFTTKSKLIYIWSIASKKFMKYGAWYQASKFWLRWFVWALRNELKQKVFLLNPQYVDTPFFENMRIEPEGKYKETLVSDILLTIQNILSSKETRFEIDL
jgi:short-subunit dehydrogenase